MTDQLQKKTEGWSGRFSSPVSDKVQKYTASISFDKRLAKSDIQGSRAHAMMLRSIGVLSEKELQKIIEGLDTISTEIQEGVFFWNVQLEDVHLNVEARLTQIVGEPGKKLHTGRSRNDQVATDLRLWLRDEIDCINQLLTDLRIAILDQAEKNSSTIMAGLTHLQTAQPITFGHHLMAYHEMFLRDQERLIDVRKRVNCLPLGSAALAGTSFNIDREYVRKQLGFESICENSIDAVSDRDFIIEFLSFSSIFMTHISRLSEEIIMWNSDTNSYVKLPDELCTGSSIMPQKKNPDVPELARGKTGRIIGNLINLLILMKAQPLAYNKDNQEDKEPLFDTVDTVKETIDIFSILIDSLIVNHSNMRKSVDNSFCTATDLADYLVAKNIAFREAHEAVSKIVSFAEKNNLLLKNIQLSKYKEFVPQIENDVYEILDPEGSIKARNHIGGTNPERVIESISRARSMLKK